ncbi:MAG TPA: hypothetical protein VGH22_23950 [Candidatus Binatia bacterium]|jgi:hypothetical protein
MGTELAIILRDIPIVQHEMEQGTMIEPDQLTDPERKLWANVLLQAQSDISARDPIARSARRWFCSREDSIGSFIWVCHHLSLDPDAARERVLRNSNNKARAAMNDVTQADNRAA